MTNVDKTEGNKNIVANLRFKYKERLEKFTDNEILAAYADFTMSDEAEDENNFLLWITDTSTG